MEISVLPPHLDSIYFQIWSVLGKPTTFGCCLNSVQVKIRENSIRVFTGNNSARSQNELRLFIFIKEMHSCKSQSP